ncbi:Peroxide-responsive repressor PerR [Candidatus Sulfobium mesophilum]|jgi:Fur family peroxide stress response transcriptional regulator|uniref:Peroxide-responsive repressor PerR n=1 Tax=Candidatus Sulfobium mesophilum TaxID=2016548 RepID=A0A2U3QFS7_9BACT|nr:Peroxide-responsive repressor PerR [Candidatus Sulfobium mesophilum]
MMKYKDIGVKLTPQRLAILDYLEGNTSHPSAEDVYRVLLDKFPTMSLATVYNTLDTLRLKGRIIALSIDPEKKRFDPNTKPHNHLICIKCKKVVDVDKTFSLGLTDDEAPDFEIMGHHIEFYGICSSCKTEEHIRKSTA